MTQLILKQNISITPLLEVVYNYCIELSDTHLVNFIFYIVSSFLKLFTHLTN